MSLLPRGAGRGVGGPPPRRKMHAAPGAPPSGGKKIIAGIVLGVIGAGVVIAPWKSWLGSEQEDEARVTFNTQHYGALGLNGKFEEEDAIDFFAG